MVTGKGDNDDHGRQLWCQEALAMTMAATGNDDDKGRQMTTSAEGIVDGKGGIIDVGARVIWSTYK